MTSSLFDEIVSDAPGDELTDTAVRALFADATGIDPDRWPATWEAVETAILGAQADLTGLHMRPGGWVINLRASAMRAVLVAALLGGTLWQAGSDQLPADVIPKVLPLLVDIRRSRLTRSEKRLLVDLRLSETTERMGFPWPVEALYGRLPAEVQNRVSPVDFAEFVEHLLQVGEADRSKHDEVRLRPAGRPAWIRLTIE